MHHSCGTVDHAVQQHSHRAPTHNCIELGRVPHNRNSGRGMHRGRTPSRTRTPRAKGRRLTSQAHQPHLLASLEAPSPVGPASVPQQAMGPAADSGSAVCSAPAPSRLPRSRSIVSRDCSCGRHQLLYRNQPAAPPRTISRSRVTMSSRMSNQERVWILPRCA